MKRRGELIISALLGGLILYGLFRHVDFGQTMQSVRQARTSLLVAGAALMVAAYLLRGARWRIWERSLTYWNSLRLVLIGFMGNNVLPARMGEVLRAHCAAAKTDKDRGRTAILASIAAERIFDGLVLAVFALIALVLVAVDSRLRDVLLLVSVAFACLTLGLIVSIRRQDRIRTFISAVNRRFPGRLATAVSGKANQLLDGLLPLREGHRIIAAIAATAGIWGLETMVCYCLGQAVWGGMSANAALLFLVVVNFASLVPLTMGGIGTIEVVGPLFLISSGISPHLALAMVLMQHGEQFVFTTFAGGVSYVAGGFHRIPLSSPKSACVVRAAVPSLNREPARSILENPGAAVESNSSARGEVALSIILPAYNEQTRLPRTVVETVRWCEARKLSFEIIVVDDGSRDGTLRLARLLEEGERRMRVLVCPHMGKGAAVRLGMLNAKGRLALFMDADGATPLDEIPKLTAAIEAGYDVAIGSRAARDGESEVSAPLHRRLVGRTFALAVRFLALGGVADTQCGFKIFRREAASEIFARQKINGFAFDVEILYIARRLSFQVAELPVNWYAQPGSKVNIARDSVRMLWDVSRVRWLHRQLRAGTVREFAPENKGVAVAPRPHVVTGRMPPAGENEVVCASEIGAVLESPQPEG